MLRFVLGMQLLWFSAFSAADSKRFVFTEKQMGTDFRIVTYGEKDATVEEAARAAFAEVARLNGIFSDYLDDSELSRLSHSSGTGKTVSVSKDLWTVLAAARKLARDTDGAFDVTVGPYVRRWRAARFFKRLPSPEKLTLARLAVGYRKLTLFPNRRAVRPEAPNMVLDLGGIAKGYAGDRALAVLSERGFPFSLVDAGGDLTLGQPPPGRKGWRVAVGGRKHPDLPLLETANLAIATSGDLEQFVEIGGTRYSHLVDPLTGLGFTTQLQVTVIAHTGIQADSLASALSVLGPKKGAAYAKTLPGVQAYFLQRIGEETVLSVSKGE